MGIRVYELSKKYGVENAVILEKLHALGYKNIRQPSNTVDKITAEYLIKELNLVEKPAEPTPAPAAPVTPPAAPAPVVPEPVAAPAAPAPVAPPPAPVAKPAPAHTPAPAPVAPAPATPAAPASAPVQPVQPAPAPVVAKPVVPVIPPAPKPVAPVAPAPTPAPVAAPKPAAPAAPAPQVVARPVAPAPVPPAAPKPPAPPVVPPRPVVVLPPRPTPPPPLTRTPAPQKPAEDPSDLPPGSRVADQPVAPASLARAHIPPDRIIQMRAPVLVRDIAPRLKMKPFQVISELMAMGIFAKVTDSLEEDVAKRLCGKRGYFFVLEKRVHERAAVHAPAPVAKPAAAPEEKAEDLAPRPPVVTIMGHVDHGKTSLLDAIRHADVAAGEAGGITQHIGAYTVQVPSPHKEKAGQKEQITFLDTPGHEAFTKMRARGANVTDIAVLVVAADDGVMPQTIESISHAKAANVPIIVAVNKMDTPGANPMTVKKQLQTHGLNPEDWGGDTICVEVSATKKLNIDKLLENILLQAELMELKANPKRKAAGSIIEAEMEPGAGPTATVLVRNGTLKQGDPVICGPYWGKVRAMYDDKGEKIKTAGPATPVRLLGLSGVPEPGIELSVVASEKEARELAEKRQQENRTAAMTPARKATREALFAAFEEGKKKTLNVVLKADVQGSVEAIAAALKDIKSEKISLEVIHNAVGAVSENDVLLASASEAIIVGFQVKMATNAADLAKREGVEIQLFSIIYELIDRVKELMAGQLEPVTKEIVIGHAEIKQVFEISKGKVAGSVVTDGRISHGARCRVLRRKAVQYEGFVQTLKRFQDDVKEVRAGLDCGIRLDNYQDFQPGDVFEAYTVEKIPQKL